MPVEVLSGNDRFVSEYFRLELLSRLPPDEAQFLTYTSVLDRMCGALCDAVLETTGSAEMLSRLGTHERLRRAARPDGRVVSLPPPVRPAPPRRARAERAGHGARAQPPRDGLVRRQRPRRGRRSTTGKQQARRTPSPAWSTPSVRRSTTTAAWRPRRSGSGGSATTSSSSTLRSPSMAPGGAR